MNRLDNAFAHHEGEVDLLLKSAQQFISALKGWKRACVEGSVGDRQKHSERAVAISTLIEPSVREAASGWSFNARDYLASDDWHNELIEAASRHPSTPNILSEGSELVCPPVVIRSEPGRASLRLGKARWTKLRPRKVIDELLRIRQRSEKQNVQEFLDSLWTATQYLNRGKQLETNTAYAKLRDIYDLFCLTPGWKKENSETAFAQ
ncbi:MAG: hypothetical protein L6Q38_09495, partial [Nitrospira sp.]|nr:hypothetical protein [Nitrospira sp.]